MDILKQNEILKNENDRLEKELIEIKQHKKDALKESTTENEELKTKIDILSKENWCLSEKL